MFPLLSKVDEETNVGFHDDVLWPLAEPLVTGYKVVWLLTGFILHFSRPLCALFTTVEQWFC